MEWGAPLVPLMYLAGTYSFGFGSTKEGLCGEDGGAWLDEEDGEDGEVGFCCSGELLIGESEMCGEGAF